MNAASALLSVRDLTVSFAGRAVVHGIDFEIFPGEKLALVGESGSGKTVTALSLLRLLPDAQVSGVAAFAGANPSSSIDDLLTIPEQRLRAVRGQDVSVIFQEPMTALNPLMTVGDQICEVLELKLGMSRKQASARAVAALQETGISDAERRVNSFPHQLSGGQRQRAMIAMAVACQPRLLLADEPTTALDVSLRSQILGLLDELQKKNGMAVLMITHDLNLVRRFASRVIVMENGVIVEQGPVSQVFSNPQHGYTRRLIDSKPVRNLIDLDGSDDRFPADPAPPAIMQARNLQVTYPSAIAGIKGWFKKGVFVAVKGANFSIATGQTLGVIGESGSGKSTLALAALGLMPFQGELSLLQRRWDEGANSNRELRKAVQVVFQDPFSSLSPRLTVEEIVGEGLLVHASTLSKEERRGKVVRALEEVGLNPADFAGLLQRYPHEFSGGQRQRIAIARALVLEPQLMVLDEPTSALDVTIQKQVLELLQRLQRDRGLSYLLITHDVDVIKAMAHQLLVMKDGEIIESGPVLDVLHHPQHEYTRILMASVD